MAYPTWLDLKAFLRSRDLECSDLTKSDYDRAVENAIEQWEFCTGWDPFISNSVDETRTIDGPEGSLIFPPFGIVALTSLTIGSLLTVSTEYWLQHRRPDSGPYMAIELAGYATGERRSVVMVGKFGFAATCPAAVKEAILSHAAWGLYPTITGIQGDILREKQGPIEFEYAKPEGGMQSGVRGSFYKLFESVCQRYKRPSI